MKLERGGVALGCMLVVSAALAQSPRAGDPRVLTVMPPPPAGASGAGAATSALPGVYSLAPSAQAESARIAFAAGWQPGLGNPGGTAGGWPMRAHDPANTGHTAALGPALQVEPAWTFRPNAGTQVWRPAIAPDGTIYVTTVSLAGGVVDGRLVALFPDGSVKWQTALTNSSGLGVWSTATPVVDGDGNIYVAWAHDRDFGNLTAISVDRSGSVRWRFEPGLELEFALHQQPVLGRDVLYAAVDTSFIFGDLSLRPSIFALDLATGTPVWRWISPNPDTFMDGPAVGRDGHIYQASASNLARGAPGFLYRIRPDGELEWSANIGAGVIQAPPVIDARDDIYIGDSAGIVSKYSSAGTRLWSYNTLAGQIFYSPVLSGTRLTVGAAFAGLHVLDADTGMLETVLAPGRYPFAQASDRAGDIFFYCFDATGTVFGFGRGGQQRWTFNTGLGTSVNSIAIAANGRLLVGNAGSLTAYFAPALGDLNCDDDVDQRDIEPYLLSLADPVKYAQRYPQCQRSLADISGDGTVDASDLALFFRLLGFR